MSTAQPNPYAPPTANVTGTVGSSDTIEQAGRGIRLGAAIIDGLVMALLIYVPALVVGGTSGLFAGSTADPYAFFFGPFGIALGVGFLIWAVITLILVKRNSQTIGKKLLGIKVVRSDGSHASLARIFWLRNIVNAIPSMIPIIGYVYSLVDHLFIFSENRQCLHDKIADTIVVKA